MVRQGMALLLCLLLCAGLCACQEEQPGKIDNLFSFILAEEEGKLLPRRGEILSPMEDVLKANGWSEKDLEENPLGDGQILTVPLEVEGLPEVTEQLRFESLEGDPVLSGVSYQIAPGGEPAATWKALEDQLSAVLKETDQVGLFTPDASLAQGEDVIWGDRDGNTLNISFGLDGEGQHHPAQRRADQHGRRSPGKPVTLPAARENAPLRLTNVCPLCIMRSRSGSVNITKSEEGLECSQYCGPPPGRALPV